MCSWIDEDVSHITRAIQEDEILKTRLKLKRGDSVVDLPSVRGLLCFFLLCCCSAGLLCCWPPLLLCISLLDVCCLYGSSGMCGQSPPPPPPTERRCGRRCWELQTRTRPSGAPPATSATRWPPPSCRATQKVTPRSPCPATITTVLLIAIALSSFLTSLACSCLSALARLLSCVPVLRR